VTTKLAPVDTRDPINTAILAISEDRLAGFQVDPLAEIARRSGVDLPVVTSRIRAMLEAGTIRRVRQTLISTKLAAGALVAWRVPAERMSAAFDYMFSEDPFSGHVVIRSTDADTPGSAYRLWTTLKVPQGYSLQKHADYLAAAVGAESYLPMPARKLFTLGVGHVRRRGLEPGSRAPEAAQAQDTEVVELNELEWRVLRAMKREFEPHEIVDEIWRPRAEEAGVALHQFFEVARVLEGKGLVGRFSTFLEHYRPLSTGERVTQYNALFHWAVPPGREIDAGREVGRHHIMTHAYWREGGPEFGNVNIMGVTHGMEKDAVLAHKEAIDRHLKDAGIPIGYTNVFWGGRSEIKPSEIDPAAYREWCASVRIDPERMRAAPDEGSASGRDGNAQGRSVMTQTQEGRATAQAQPVIQQAVHFAFYKLSRDWWRLDQSERERIGGEFADLLQVWGEKLLLVSYSLVGIRADCHMMLWKAASSVEEIHEMGRDISTSSIAPYLEPAHAYLSLTRRSVYVRNHKPDGDRTRVAPVGARYLFVYPFVKTRAWYALAMERRQEMMNEHIRVGNKYQRVKLNTTYSFGLDDQEFVLAFETDHPSDFLDLVMELRETEASQYTLRDTPIFTCLRAEGEDLLAAIGAARSGILVDKVD
jgi:chlorite dismutase/DNA-binding Lrp family transcriptional regulator